MRFIAEFFQQPFALQRLAAEVEIEAAPLIAAVDHDDVVDVRRFVASPRIVSGYRLNETRSFRCGSSHFATRLEFRESRFRKENVIASIIDIIYHDD